MTPMRKARRVALALGLTIACGPATTTSTTTTTTTSTATTGLPDRCEGACTDGERCLNGLDWQCTCEHHPDINCGGAQRRLGPGTWAWACVRPNPPPPAATDCPASTPADASPCTAVTDCTYRDGGCGWSGANAHCDGSTWRVEQWMLPPPP
jgi:hypothetical protein